MIGVGIPLSYFIGYYILTSYLEEIQFTVASISAHIVFSVVKNGLFVFGGLFLIIMYGAFLAYIELSKEKYKLVSFNLWWTSLLVLFLFHVGYWGGSILFKFTQREGSIYLLTLMVGLQL